MPLSEIQRATPPLAKGTPWRKWWYEHGHQLVSEVEKQQWLRSLEQAEQEQAAKAAKRKGERKR